eukprot:g13908.t1
MPWESLTTEKKLDENDYQFKLNLWAFLPKLQRKIASPQGFPIPPEHWPDTWQVGAPRTYTMPQEEPWYPNTLLKDNTPNSLWLERWMKEMRETDNDEKQSLAPPPPNSGYDDRPMSRLGIAFPRELFSDIRLTKLGAIQLETMQAPLQTDAREDYRPSAASTSTRRPMELACMQQLTSDVKLYSTQDERRAPVTKLSGITDSPLKVRNVKFDPNVRGYNADVNMQKLDQIQRDERSILEATVDESGDSGQEQSPIQYDVSPLPQFSVDPGFVHPSPSLPVMSPSSPVVDPSTTSIPPTGPRAPNDRKARAAPRNVARTTEPLAPCDIRGDPNNPRNIISGPRMANRCPLVEMNASFMLREGETCAPRRYGKEGRDAGCLRWASRDEAKKNGVTPIHTGFVDAFKHNESTGERKYKSRLVIFGNRMSAYEHFSPYETSTPAAHHFALLILCAIMVALNALIKQIDFSQAYIHANTEDLVYAVPPEDFRKDDDPWALWLVLKALYGSPQAGCRWHDHVARLLRSIGYQQSTVDPCVFFLRDSGRAFPPSCAKDCDSLPWVLLLKTDDMLVFCFLHSQFRRLISELKKAKFRFKDMNDVQVFTGLQFKRFPEWLLIHQRAYVRVDQFMVSLSDYLDEGEESFPVSSDTLTSQSARVCLRICTVPILLGGISIEC